MENAKLPLKIIFSSILTAAAVLFCFTISLDRWWLAWGLTNVIIPVICTLLTVLLIYIIVKATQDLNNILRLKAYRRSISTPTIVQSTTIESMAIFYNVALPYAIGIEEALIIAQAEVKKCYIYYAMNGHCIMSIGGPKLDVVSIVMQVQEQYPQCQVEVIEDIKGTSVKDERQVASQVFTSARKGRARR